MNPNPIQNGPLFEGPYVPYFYQAGLYRVQPVAPGGMDQSTVGRTYAVYDFTSEASPWTQSHEPQTVEQIIQRGYFAVPVADPETALISDKRDTSRLGLEDTIRQIRDRYQIYEHNAYDIELGKCAAITSLFALEAERGGVPADSKELYGLSKVLQRFYQEQRDERVKLWQDVARIRERLPETAQQYLAAYRKMAILESDDGDAL